MMEPLVLKTGTTTVGIVCKDGVILGADKRATADNLIVDKRCKKIHLLTEKIALTMAGSVSDVQLLIKLARAELKLKELRALQEPSVKEAVGLLSGMVYNNIRKMSMLPGISHFIIGGLDKTGIYLYDLFPDGSLTEYPDYVSSGSGSVFAMGVLDTMYGKDMTTEEGIELAIKAINAALHRDSASGDGISIVAITKTGVKEYSDNELTAKIEAVREVKKRKSKD